MRAQPTRVSEPGAILGLRGASGSHCTSCVAAAFDEAARMRLFAGARTKGGIGRRHSYPRLHCFGDKRGKSNTVAVLAKSPVAHRSPRFAELAPTAASDREKEEVGEARRSASDALTRLLPLVIDSFEGVLFVFDPSSDLVGSMTGLRVVLSTSHRSCLVVICTLLSP
jgi:hypothetical protein